jgi:hypothetical protein
MVSAPVKDKDVPAAILELLKQARPIPTAILHKNFTDVVDGWKDWTNPENLGAGQ